MIRSIREAPPQGTTSPTQEPPALHDRAIENISFIRRTMEGAASFTDVPGRGLMMIGALGVAGAFLASRQTSPNGWLTAWLCTAGIAGSVGIGTMLHKMRRRLGAGGALHLSAPARKFILGLWPALFAGAVLTLALVDTQFPDLGSAQADRMLPGLWLLLYGVGITTAGTHAIRAVPLMGGGFAALGTLALFSPVDGDLMMALGFGVLHLAFGFHIARRHGG